MRTNFWKLLRTAAVALVFGFATAPAAEAGWRTTESTAATTRTRHETLWGLPRNHPAIAVAAVAGGIALIVFFAWVAARVGDKA